jgi:hypothetical protein
MKYKFLPSFYIFGYIWETKYQNNASFIIIFSFLSIETLEVY